MTRVHNIYSTYVLYISVYIHLFRKLFISNNISIISARFEMHTAFDICGRSLRRISLMERDKAGLFVTGSCVPARNLTTLQLTRPAAVIRLLNARLPRSPIAARSRQMKFQRNYSDAPGNKDAGDLFSYIYARFHFALPRRYRFHDDSPSILLFLSLFHSDFLSFSRPEYTLCRRRSLFFARRAMK